MTLTNDVYIEKGSEMSQKPISQDVAVSSLIPWKSRERNGAQAIVEQLKVAGLIGDSQNLVIGNPGSGEEWLYLELDDQVQMGLAEAAVGSIVDGASRLYSKPTVAIAHGFVGFSGLQGSVFNAAQRQSPMLVIVGTADSHAHTGETHMYADVEGAAKAARAKYVKNATDPATLLRDLRDAIIQAQIPPFGPVVFIVGFNVTSAPNNEKVIKPKLPNYKLAPPDCEIEELVDQILKFNNPVLLIGDGVARSGAQTELVNIAEKLAAEVWASMESEVNFPRHHPLYRGNLGHMDDARGRELLNDADFVLAIGTPVYQTVFNSKLPLLRPDVPIATINQDIETSIRGHNDVTLPIKGDPKRILTIFLDLLEKKQSPEQASKAVVRLQQLQQKYETALKERRKKHLDNPGVSMAKFGKFLEERMKQMASRPVIFNEALVGANGFTDFIKNVDIVGTYFDTSGGSLGEWAGAVGAAIVGNGKRIIAIIGDGGFHYTVPALWNAAQKKLPLGLVVANNASYRLLYDNMNNALKNRGINSDSIPRQHYYELPGINYVQIANGYGVKGKKVERVDQLEAAINEMLETNQPFLIDLILTEELLTEKQVSDFIQDWFNKLDHHSSLEEVLPLVSDECLVMQLPEGTLYGKDEFKNWYEGVINTFFDEIHKVEETKINIEPKEITVNLTLEWRASRWKPPESNSEKLAFKAVQTWTLKGSPITKNAVITKYIVHKLTPLEGFPPL